MFFFSRKRKMLINICSVVKRIYIIFSSCPEKLYLAAAVWRRKGGVFWSMAAGLGPATGGLRVEQKHGKSRVRVCRVWRNGKDGACFMAEWNVGISLLSDCLPAYVSGDNSTVVATDTMKNTVRIGLYLLFFFLLLSVDGEWMVST